MESPFPTSTPSKYLERVLAAEFNDGQAVVRNLRCYLKSRRGDSGIEQGGSGCLDIRIYLLGGSAIGHSVRVRDMGPDTTHEEGVVWIPPQGSPQADGAEIAEGSGRRLCFPPARGCDGGGRFTGVGDLRLPFLEHSPKIYCD